MDFESTVGEFTTGARVFVRAGRYDGEDRDASGLAGKFVGVGHFCGGSYIVIKPDSDQRRKVKVALVLPIDDHLELLPRVPRKQRAAQVKEAQHRLDNWRSEQYALSNGLSVITECGTRIEPEDM